jgi:hypothetical protein
LSLLLPMPVAPGTPIRRWSHTIMLWIGGQVTTWNIIHSCFPSFYGIFARTLIDCEHGCCARKGETSWKAFSQIERGTIQRADAFEQKFLFISGCLALLSVPFFKSVTPFTSLHGCAARTRCTSGSSRNSCTREKKLQSTSKGLNVNYYSAAHMIRPVFYFFSGILLAVGALETSWLFEKLLAEGLNNSVGNIYAIQYPDWNIVCHCR